MMQMQTDPNLLLCMEQLGHIEIFDTRTYKPIYQYQHPTKEWIIDATLTERYTDEYAIAIYERGLEFIQFEQTANSSYKIKDGFQTTYFSFQKIHCISHLQKDHFLVAISG